MKYEEFVTLIPIYESNNALKKKVNDLELRVDAYRELVITSSGTTDVVKIQLNEDNEHDKKIIKHVIELLNRKIKSVDDFIKEKLEMEELEN